MCIPKYVFARVTGGGGGTEEEELPPPQEASAASAQSEMRLAVRLTKLED
jgi:hypothetical protein